MDKKKCSSCGGTPHKCSCKNKEFTKAVIEIDNPEQITLMRKVVIPVSMGDDTTVPPTIGKYHNVLLYYEANSKSYLYSSDGIPTQLVNGFTNYEEAINLPQINGVTLMGDKNSAELKLADAPMVITVASGNTSWSGADTAEDVYDFFLNKGKVNIVFSGGENYAYEIASAGYIENEGKLLCVVVAASTQNTGGVTDFDGNALFGTMTLYTAGKAVDVSQIELQPKLYIADFTGLDLNYNELSGVPATNYSIGMVKPGDGLEVASDGTLSISDIEQYAHLFDTVADMKAATNLVAGDYVKTLGYYTKDDMGGACYKISSTAPSGHYETLTSGLYAELILEGTMNVKQFGAKGDGSTDDTVAIQSALDNCSNRNAILIFPNSIYASRELTSSEITINGGGATIKAYDDSTSVLLTINDYSEINNLNFDGNNLSSTLLHSNSFKIRIVNCMFENSLGDAIDNTPVQDDNSEAYFDNVEFHNCVGGIRYLGYAYDDPDDYKGSVKFINCRSTGNTGSSDSNRIYFFQKLNYVSVRGGDFTGDLTHGATNIYQVNHGEIIGGYYHDMLRGATLGLITKNCTVTNTINENITGGGGLHIDLVTADRVHPEGHSIIANNIVKNAYRGMFIQGKNLLINNNYIYCGTNTQTTGGVIRFNDNDDNTSNSNVVVDNLYVYNLGSNSNVITCGTAVITLGSVYLDGTNIVQASVASDNPIIKNNTRIGEPSGSTQVTINDDVIIINATGACNIMLPNSNETKTLGKKYTIVRTDDTASTVSLRCRSDSGTINGQTSGAGNVPIAKGVTNVVQTGAGEYWTLS